MPEVATLSMSRPSKLPKLLIAGAALLMAGAGAFAKTEADDRAAVYGIWATSGTMIEVGPAAEGLSARIIALKNPVWREKDGIGVVGQPKTDLRNPDKSKRDNPLIGLEMLRNYTFRKGKWRGKLYLPSNGSTWTSTALIKEGELQIRGYIGLSMFGKTQTFAPLASCNRNILRMIRNAGMKGTPCDAILAEPASATGAPGFSRP